MNETTDSRKAWQDFWKADEGSSGSARTGCLPDAWQGIDQVQNRVWAEFAAKLPRHARVLDLATGDGRVMAKLLRARRDLKPIGIDQADELPAPPRGAKVRSGVLLHELPFPDASFAAVTSQFGFEYGDMDAAAVELTRVLVSGGRVGMIVHRTDSPIVAHNRNRRQQIEWAVTEQDLPGLAMRYVHARQLGLGVIPAPVMAAPEAGATLFGAQSAAWEIAEAIRRTLLASAGEPPAQTAAVIERIVAQARNELGRIASLEMAASASGHGEKVAESLARAGLLPSEDGALNDGRSTAPFATLLVFRKP